MVHPPYVLGFESHARVHTRARTVHYVSIWIDPAGIRKQKIHNAFGELGKTQRNNNAELFVGIRLCEITNEIITEIRNIRFQTLIHSFFTKTLLGI